MKIRKQNLTERLSINTQIQKPLGVHIDYKLKFDTHIETLCKKVGRKLHALARVIKYMSTNHGQMLMTSFMMSRFSYCPLIWMCHSRKINSQLNKLHKRALRLAYTIKALFLVTSRNSKKVSNYS